MIGIEALASTQGVLLRRDAVAAGVDDDALRRLVKSRALVRIRQGAYAIAERWITADPATRHLMLVDAVSRQYGDHVVLSHSSAAVLHGAPTWGLDLTDVHLTHFSGGGRRGAGVVHHDGVCRVTDVTRLGTTWATSPARTALDTATIVDTEAGTVLASDFLHRGLTTHAELEQLAALQERWPNTLGHHVVLRVADRRFESVGEARCGHLFWRYQLPRPEPQWKVLRPNGRVLYRVDFAWPKLGVACEFDGRIKYTRYRRPGESIEETVLREKRREERIIELTGFRIIRITWGDLATPEATIARLRRVLRRAA